MFNIDTYPKTLGKDLVVKKVGHFVDTFYGKDGWNNHARFKIVTTKNDKFLSQVSGHKLPHHIFKQVTSQVI